MTKRWLHKSWQDKRPGWKRRARWYEGDTIRIRYEDELGLTNRVYIDSDYAQAEFDAFKAGELDTIELRAE